MEKAMEIRRSSLPRKDLARLHGIDVSLVGMIQRNQVWKES